MIDPVSSGITQLGMLRQQGGLESVPITPGKIGEGLIGGAIERGRGPGAGGFSDMIGGLVQSVDEKSKVADGEVRKLMLGESDNIHRSMIAMQESGLSFSLLVEVRNKLVESYQELMRMPV